MAGNLEVVKKHAANGVRFIDENNVYIDETVVIGSGTVIEPNVVLRGETVIGQNATIGFCSELTNAKIADNVTIRHSVICDSEVGAGTNAGAVCVYPAELLCRAERQSRRFCGN